MVWYGVVMGQKKRLRLFDAVRHASSAARGKRRRALSDRYVARRGHPSDRRDADPNSDVSTLQDTLRP